MRAVAVCATLVLQALANGAVIHVDSTYGNDDWDGLCAVWDGGSCGPKATIQAGINAAVDGDTVLVADGVYSGADNQNLDPVGKLITIKSASGDPAACVIDCQNTGRAFYFNNWETPDTIVDGFTLRNGQATPVEPPVLDTGGGVYVGAYSAPTIRNCVIENNYTAGFGGGVFCYMASAPAITNCAITGNTSDNPGDLSGGGIFCYQSEAVFTGCRIENNHAPLGGGGAATFFLGGTPRLVACTLSGNTAANGGALHADGSYGRLINCLLTGNDAIQNGAVLYNLASNIRLINCTIAGNFGGIYVDSAEPILVNCVLWGNAGWPIYGPGSAAVSYSDVQYGYAGSGNIDTDPLFVDPVGPDGDPSTWTDNDYHLAAASPCIDTGSNAGLALTYGTDIDGQIRRWDGNGDDVVTIDMGIDEFGSTFHGDTNCNGVVEFGDINPFVLALTDPVAYQAMYPDCELQVADVNMDGTVSFADINPFVALLSGS